MHKFAVVHKLSGIVCYSTNREIRFESGFNYEIVSNSAELKTTTPNLNFDSYSEIANALDLSDKIVFSTDADDNLTISDGSRSVTIPTLLFQETLLDVEESVFGDVCEILEDFGFNNDCTELLAHNAVKFWVAVRFLETTETTETTKVIAENLEIHDSSEFVGESAFTYQGDEYLLCDFVYTTEYDGWHGVMGLSYFSAYYVRMEEDDTVTLGYSYW